MKIGLLIIEPSHPFTSAFGVAGLGHRHPEIVAAMKEQSDQLLHGMGPENIPRITRPMVTIKPPPTP
ncbi:MAG: hypothetical protein ACPHOK_08340, partial [Akkermansiaceae bacterium]